MKKTESGEAPVFKSKSSSPDDVSMFTSKFISDEEPPMFTSTKSRKEFDVHSPIDEKPKKGLSQKSLSSDNGGPVFKSHQSEADSAPVFKSHQSEVDSAPVFRSQQSEIDSAPVFRSGQTEVESAPIFSSAGRRNSAPIFGSSRRRNADSCYYHSNNEAVATCSNCGRPICENCREIGEAEDGSIYCFDCINAVVQEDVDLAKSKRLKIIGKIVLSIALAGVFFFLTFNVFSGLVADDGNFKILLPLFGAALPIYGPLFKAVVKWTWRFIRWKPVKDGIMKFILDFIKFAVVIGAIMLLATMFAVFVTFSPIVALVLAIVDFVKYKRADNLVKRNQEILQNLSDHMEYIKLMSEENLTADELANDERMQDNYFAQSVRREGFTNASKNIADERQEMVENDKQIKKFIVNEYGEAVRVA